jgi:hypothetical protein
MLKNPKDDRNLNEPHKEGMRVRVFVIATSEEKA